MRCCNRSPREGRDAAPGEIQDQIDAQARYRDAWRERWRGLRGWFFRSGHEPSQAELSRARARSAIPQLLAAIAALNERRSGRSDRSADFRVLAGWKIWLDQCCLRNELGSLSAGWRRSAHRTGLQPNSLQTGNSTGKTEVLSLETTAVPEIAL
jgi:uncharacterized protein (TIGR02677 family)